MRFQLFTLLLLLGSCFCASAQSNYFTVKFPDDKTYLGCGASVPVESPVVTQYSCNTNVGISRTDMKFNTNESGTCFKILRTWRLVYWCGHDPNAPFTVVPNPSNTDVGATAIGNSSNRGMLEYVQVIKVRDQEPPVFLNCPAGPVEFCDYTNNDPAQYQDRCEGPVNFTIQAQDACSGTDLTLAYRFYLDLDNNGSMETFITSSAANAWPIQITKTATTVEGKIIFPTGHGFPYGTHKIEWIAGDNCGNEQICKYSFVVRDCKAPTVVCLNGLSVNIMQTGMIALNLQDFLLYTNDNCTPVNQIKVGIRKGGTGSGFPTGIGNQTVGFDCSELGTQFVEVWSQDAAGNADFCITYVQVQDNSGSCISSGVLKGAVKSEQGQAISGATLVLKNQGQQVKGNATTDSEGQFEMSDMMAACNYTLSGQLNDAASNGVTTLDALMIDAYTQGILSFNSPYKIRAADVDENEQVNALDAISVVQVAVGTSVAFPSAPSWLFLPSSQAIDETNALQAATALEALCLEADNSGMDVNFTAIKAGDVNGSAASPNFTGSTLDDRSDRTSRKAVFHVQEKILQTGATINVPIYAPYLSGLAGFQFALDYNPALLQLQNVTGALAPIYQTGRFDSEHTISVGWQNPLGLQPGNAALFVGQEVFNLRFTVLGEGKLSEALMLHPTKISNEAYIAPLTVRSAKLEYDPLPVSVPGLVVLPPQPNPAKQGQSTLVRYWLPNTDPAQLELRDARGVLQQQIALPLVAGWQEVTVDLNTAVSGVLLLQLRSEAGVAVRKLVVE